MDHFAQQRDSFAEKLQLPSREAYPEGDGNIEQPFHTGKLL